MKRVWIPLLVLLLVTACVPQSGPGTEQAGPTPHPALVILVPTWHKALDLALKDLEGSTDADAPEQRQAIEADRILGQAVGYVVADGRAVITALSPYDASLEYDVHFQDGTKIRASEIVWDERLDITILTLPEPAPATLHLDAGRPSTAPLFMLGALRPGPDRLKGGTAPDIQGWTPVTVPGEIGGPKRLSKNTQFQGYVGMIPVTTEFPPGFAGGLAHDASDRVIGLLRFRYRPGLPVEDRISFLLRPAHLIYSVEQALRGDYAPKPPAIRRGLIGLQVQEINAEIAEAFDIPIDGALLIASVTPGGAAERAGLRKGDLLTHLDKAEMGSFDDLLRFTLTLPPDAEVAARYNRLGRVGRTVLTALEPSS